MAKKKKSRKKPATQSKKRGKTQSKKQTKRTTKSKRTTKRMSKRTTKRNTKRTAKRTTKRAAASTAKAAVGRDLFSKATDWRKLTHDIAGALHAGSEQLGSHVQDLEARAMKMAGPARKHLLDAAKSLRKAQQEAQRPVRDELTKGIMSIARTMGLPLGTTAKASGGRMPVAPTPQSREGRGKNQAFVNAQLQAAGPEGAKVTDIKEAAAAAGLNPTSVGQAVTKMASDGQIKRVGRGRYTFKG
ncbi:hypothetical protein ACERK3_08860 [Phycisphaerales bacterium AB-hyl4]|uniref:Uncharacterized protein n=1 Tax=Natronomicrosphaera hydrolytica TaxID=3242702 RepID=A0ABV4U5F6_9BACT